MSQARMIRLGISHPMCWELHAFFPDGLDPLLVLRRFPVFSGSSLMSQNLRQNQEKTKNACLFKSDASEHVSNPPSSSQDSLAGKNISGRKACTRLPPQGWKQVLSKASFYKDPAAMLSHVFFWSFCCLCSDVKFFMVSKCLEILGKKN